MLTEYAKNEAIDTTKKWVETMIIGLNLCPFAKAPFQKDTIRFVVKDALDMQGFMNVFAEEIQFLDKNASTETTLIILPAFSNVQQFMAFMGFCEQTILLNNWVKKYQIVSFHPNARFQGFAPDSPQNLVGMAPYPVLHILRVASVEGLGATLKKDVIEENDAKLRQISKEEVAELWKKIMA